MKFKSTLLGPASGSLAGATASHNRGGQYLRTRATPVNPNSVFQQAIKSYMGVLATAWRDELDGDQRDGWDIYAELTPRPDAFGDPRNVGGLGMYIRGNLPRLQAGMARVDDPPASSGLPSFGGITNVTVSAVATNIGFEASLDGGWDSEDGAGLLVYASYGYPTSINYFKGPYRFAGVVLGNSTTPPTNPMTVPEPYAYSQGQKVFLRAQIVRADGRMSPDYRLDTTATI